MYILLHIWILSNRPSTAPGIKIGDFFAAIAAFAVKDFDLNRSEPSGTGEGARAYIAFRHSRISVSVRVWFEALAR
jgi:hypothetical protein